VRNETFAQRDVIFGAFNFCPSEDCYGTKKIDERKEPLPLAPHHHFHWHLTTISSAQKKNKHQQ